MIDQKTINYSRIEQAIHYISSHFKQQPSLDDIAAHLNMSPFHFQRIFTAWAGVSPKKFMQYLSVSYAKNLLRQNLSLQDTAFETGLSGTSRLHDLFIKIESMTPGEFKKGALNLSIFYSYASTIFGEVIIASTEIGVCHLHFSEDRVQALSQLKSQFPNARFVAKTVKMHEIALAPFTNQSTDLQPIKLHLSATPFQLKVWESLLKIPLGALSTYGNIAESIDKPNASRAVGTAIGRNPIAFLIPCHRVIQNTGNIGGYMWGIDRKRVLIGWEAVQTDENNA